MYLHNSTGYANLFIVRTEGMKEIIQHLFQQCFFNSVYVQI